jgi:hypothetical protein
MSVCVLMLYCCAAGILILDVWMVATAKRSPDVCFAAICIRLFQGMTPQQYLIIYTTLEFAPVSPPCPSTPSVPSPR